MLGFIHKHKGIELFLLVDIFSHKLVNLKLLVLVHKHKVVDLQLLTLVNIPKVIDLHLLRVDHLLLRVVHKHKVIDLKLLVLVHKHKVIDLHLLRVDHLLLRVDHLLLRNDSLLLLVDRLLLRLILRHKVRYLLLLCFILFFKLHDFSLEALRLQGVERDLLGQCMHVNLFRRSVTWRFLDYGIGFGSVPGTGLRGALLRSTAVGSGAEVGLALGGDRLRRSSFRLLALDVGFRGGSGAHSRRRFVGAGGSGGVLRHSLGNVFGWSVGPTRRIDLGGKGDRGEDGCDSERGSHKCVVEDNILKYEESSLFITSTSYEKPVLF